MENPVTVHPDPFLANIARQEDWPILTPPRLNNTRFKFYLGCTLQAIGLFRLPVVPTGK